MNTNLIADVIFRKLRDDRQLIIKSDGVVSVYVDKSTIAVSDGDRIYRITVEVV